METEAKIGVFICDCGTEITGFIETEALVDRVRDLPHVTLVQRGLYNCSREGQKKIKQAIAEQGLNRVVVAGCTPRTHEPLFRALCEEAGLNVIPLPDAIRQELKRTGNAIWDWIGNPADFSISMGDESSAEQVAKLMAAHPDFDFLITFVSGPWRRGPEPFSLEKHLERYSLQDMKNKPVVMVFQNRPRYSIDDGEMAEYDKIVTEMETRFIQDGYPMYPDIKRAASAVNKMIGYYEKRR